MTPGIAPNLSAYPLCYRLLLSLRPFTPLQLLKGYLICLLTTSLQSTDVQYGGQTIQEAMELVAAPDSLHPKFAYIRLAFAYKRRCIQKSIPMHVLV